MVARTVKKWLLGNPLTTSQIRHERLSNPRALAIFASDALSSVAYATEAILLTLIVAGTGALTLSLPIAIAITLLLVVLIVSYRQTVVAYPGGGGSYSVAKENLGVHVGLIAAAALLVDYILTVAVSISAAVSAFTSAFPEFDRYRIPVAIAMIVIIALVNLRGVKESGKIFTIPTYAFIVCIIALLAIGFGRFVFDPDFKPAAIVDHPQSIQTLGIFLILKAFASGCTALTGIEAISNGVTAFREPTGKNAKKTLFALGCISAILFLGITILARLFHVVPRDGETVISQLARTAVGGTFAEPFYYAVQGATMLILVLASNTAFSDYPRLSNILSRDRFMPKQFSSVGDRLVYSSGIIFLALASSVLVWMFSAREHLLLPFYAIGVFTAFTISQAGMAVFWWKRKHESRWVYVRCALGVLGAGATCIVFVLELITKAAHGAYVVPLVVFGLILLFRKIRSHYDEVNAKLVIGEWRPQLLPKHTVILPIDGVHRAVLSALARVMEDKPSRIIALHVSINRGDADALRELWKTHAHALQTSIGYEGELTLEIIHCEYPQEAYVVDSIVEFIRNIDRRYDDDRLTVVLPHLVPHGLLGRFLHNHTSRAIAVAIEQSSIDADTDFASFHVK